MSKLESVARNALCNPSIREASESEFLPFASSNPKQLVFNSVFSYATTCLREKNEPLEETFGPGVSLGGAAGVLSPGRNSFIGGSNFHWHSSRIAQNFDPGRRISALFYFRPARCVSLPIRDTCFALAPFLLAHMREHATMLRFAVVSACAQLCCGLPTRPSII